MKSSEPTQETESDVVVIGAGFAGLAAARTIKRAGLRVEVLEARDRIGGRTFNFDLGDGVITEGGGQFLGPTQDRLAALAAEYGVGTFPSYTAGRDRVLIDGEPSELDLAVSGPDNDLPDLIGALQALADTIPLERPWSVSDAAQLDDLDAGAWLDSNARTPIGRKLLAAMITTMFGNEPEQLSLLFVAHYIAAAGNRDEPGDLTRLIRTESGAQGWRFTGGSVRVAQHIADELAPHVHLLTPATAVEHGPDGVRVRSGTRMFRADRLIVAAPPQTVDRITFRPALPARRRAWHAELTLGRLSKFHAVYPTPFWRADGLSGNAFLAGDSFITSVFDNSPVDRDGPGILFAFAGGRPADELAALSPADRRERILAAFSLVVGDQAHAATGFHEFQPGCEPWSLGGPGPAARPGLLTKIGEAIREPVGRVHWAGTETSTQWPGYIEGAILSGERAAAEVVAAEFVAPEEVAPAEVDTEEVDTGSVVSAAAPSAT